jgi:hypothetical protein
MQTDPIRQVRALYEWLDEPVSEEFATAMRVWWEENAERREANVHPAPETFGLDLDDVRRRFASYCARTAEWTRSKETSR